MPAHVKIMHMGLCAMCGVEVTVMDDGKAVPHERNDILAMLGRGDFDRGR